MICAVPPCRVPNFTMSKHRFSGIVQNYFCTHISGKFFKYVCFFRIFHYIYRFHRKIAPQPVLQGAKKRKIPCKISQTFCRQLLFSAHQKAAALTRCGSEEHLIQSGRLPGTNRQIQPLHLQYGDRLRGGMPLGAQDESPRRHTGFDENSLFNL